MSKFQVSINDTIITGSGVMIIYFYKGLTRNLEIPPSELCPNFGNRAELGISKLPDMLLMKCY